MELPGVLLYSHTEDEAIIKDKILALQLLADRLEHGESVPGMNNLNAGVSWRIFGHWHSTKARRVLTALLRIGWSIKRQKGISHKILSSSGWDD